MDDALLAVARERRDEARRNASAARQAAEGAEDEFHRLDEAVMTLEGIKHEQDDFNEAARRLLG